MAMFEGKRILITGGTSGIGLAGAKMIVEQGGEVAVTGTSQSHLDEAGHSLPSGSLVLRNDASDPNAARELAEKVKEQMGEIDGLWLNAGFGRFGENTGVTAESFDAITDVNVRGPFLQMAGLIPLIKDGGAVVVTASIAAHIGQAMGAVYGASKAAILAAARSWASDLASRNIRVNSVSPGPIESNFFEGTGMSEEQIEGFASQIESQVPLGRFGTSGEAAQVALFLLSDHSSYVTGSEYVVDGGMALR